ncbi:MAG: response regulator [Betaproteobacteria bacterium]
MAQDPLSLLVVEDSELDFELLLAVLQRDRDHLGRPVRACRVEEEAGLRAALARGRFDALITDHNLPRFDSFAALRAARALDADLPVIVLSGEMSEELAVAVLQAGADDFVLKTRMFRLGPALKRSLLWAEARRDRRAQALALADNEARLRQLTHRLEGVREEERRRLAQEVHDDIGTTLTALKFELARLGRDLGDHPVAAPRLLAMNELLAHAVAASHRIQHNLHPPVLDAGLAAALEWLARGFSERTGVPARFESNRDDVPLSASRAAAIYRVAQEALANCAKHAHARRVTLQLFAGPEEITLEVSDDGVGFDPAMLEATLGLGLRGLLERARGLGGWAEVNSAAGRGTTLMFSVPAEPETAAAAGNARPAR